MHLTTLSSELQTQLAQKTNKDTTKENWESLIDELIELGMYNSPIIKYLSIINYSLPRNLEHEITIYRGSTPHSLNHTNCTCWTTNFNLALAFANRQNNDGLIYQGKINKNQILALVHRHKVLDLIAYNNDVYDVSPLALYTNEQLPILIPSIVKDEYNYFAQQLKEDWFFHKSTIHGKEHTLRVLLHALIINHMEQLNSSTILGYSALLHDIGRTNDSADLTHGQKAIDRLLEKKLPLMNISEEELEIIKFIVINHCVDDEHIPISTKPDYAPLLWAFKDADNLDRVRVSDLNIKYLRTDTAKKLPQLAYQFLYHQL